MGGIIPETFDFALPLEPYGYDPQKAKALLAAAGYAKGFDAGEYSCDAVYAGVIEGVVNDLAAVGIPAEPDPSNPSAELGIYNVVSGSDALAIDGSKYSDW